MFETEKEVLDWYECQPRTVTKEFVAGIPWDEVRRHSLSPAFVPVLFYMRDVESYTDIYYQELRRTPTGKDPIIKRFMQKWGVEEAEHGDLLHRFLAEADLTAEDKWQEKAKAAIPLRYTLEGYYTAYLTNCFGKFFSGTHMVWGAINELTTLHGYRRLWQLSSHPVLEKILRAVAAEESVHANFYWQIARIRLQRSKLARELARIVINKFWTPVGQGAKPQSQTDYVIATLFSEVAGVDFFDRHVTQKISRLPGLTDMRTVTQRISDISLNPLSSAVKHQGEGAFLQEMC